MNELSRSELELMAQASSDAYIDELPIGDALVVSGSVTDYTLVLKETHGEQRDKDAWLVGFGGQAYFSESENRLVIAFEGSDVESLRDVFRQDWTNTNIPMALGFTSDQSASAFNFAIRAIQDHAVDGTQIIFTGHSLGGYLAQVALVWTARQLELDGRAPAQAVVFNAPGWGGLGADSDATPTGDVTYIYSADWGRGAVPLIHSLGERLSDEVYYMPGTSGHGIEPLLEALATYDPIPTSGNGPRLVPLPTTHSDQNYWEVFNEALDRRTMVTFEWSFDNGSGLRYTLEQRLHPGGDVRNGGETGVAFVIRTFVRTEDGRLLTPAEMRELGHEAHVVGTRLDGGNWTWEERCFVAGTPITLADGTTRPIEAIRPGDRVLSYAADGTLTPARVTRTFVNEAACVLDFHATGVTPGHVFLCGAGRFAGRHVPLIDILRDDGAVVRSGGGLMRRPGRGVREGAGMPLTSGMAGPMGLLAQGPAPAMRGGGRGARCVA